MTFVFDDDSDISWRILLGVGSLPGILLTVLRRTSRRKRQEHVVTNVNTGHDAEKLPLQEIHQRDENVDGDEPTLLEAIRLEENIFKKLLGTAGCWFLFDVLFYGNSLFQTIVLEAIFGGAESISSLALDQTIVASLALPGYFISVIVMGKQTPRKLDSIWKTFVASQLLNHPHVLSFLNNSRLHTNTGLLGHGNIVPHHWVDILFLIIPTCGSSTPLRCNFFLF